MINLQHNKLKEDTSIANVMSVFTSVLGVTKVDSFIGNCKMTRSYNCFKKCIDRYFLFFQL